MVVSGPGTVIFTGFQAAGTRGRAMTEGRPSVRVHGEDVPVKSEFMTISGLSAHADKDDLLDKIKKKLPKLPKLPKPPKLPKLPKPKLPKLPNPFK